ncbi:unnamed protein product [Spirodela intermedia]|uniref:Uncharacterized protein n=1 Tax=Spirodela intermedia TaxID=51605 RepID=A0A7I8KW39_SPIIN|nr:unnamed protein product [Spirodela intermedia]
MATALLVAQTPAASGQRMRRPSIFSSSSISASSISRFISDHPPLTLLETSCRNMKDLRALHSQLVKTGLSEDPIAISRVLSFCATHPAGDLNYALRLFSRIASPTAFSCNTILRAASGSSAPLLALLLFLDMLSLLFLIPQRLTFPSLFVACRRLARADVGAQLHAMAAKLGFAEDPYIKNSMISMYGSCGDLEAAEKIFSSSIRKEAVFDVVACNSMLTALLRKGLAQQARRLFDEMPQRTISTWSTLMSGYLRNGLFQETLSLFGELQRTTTPELHPNPCCLVSLLGACAGLGALEQGEWAHETLIRTHREAVDNNPIILNAIIHMYCKCGRLDKALIAFEASPTRALSSWNAIIGALAIHGRCPEAVQLFSQLEPVHGLKPDAVTFVAVLTACSHAGMVDEARMIFASMSEKHGVEPAVEHYGCMVDALARAGHLQAAEDLIRGMTTPLRPDAAVWGALLAGSRSHGDVERAARAAAEILILDPADGGGYLLLANALAGSGGFGDSAAVRAAVKEKRIRNKPGCSMIEVKGVVHEFLA